MKRKTSSVPTRIWNFWCYKHPTMNEEAMNEQFKLGRLYKNKLIELEKERRASYDTLMKQTDELAPVEAKIVEKDGLIEEFRRQIRATRQAARTRVDTLALSARVKEMCEEVRALKEHRKAIKAVLKVRLEGPIDVLYADFYAKKKLAYNESKAFWGTKLLIDKELEAASSTPSGPQFCRWDGRGRIGVQLQDRMTVTKLFSQNTWLRLCLADETLPSTSGKRRLDSVMMRIGSTEADGPLWVKFPCRLHREIPPDGQVKWAWIRRYKVGPRTRFELSLMLEARSFAVIPKKMPRSPNVVGIDIGWRKQNELRFAYYNDGHSDGEYTVPSRTTGKIGHAEGLRSLRDELFDTARDVLSKFVASNPDDMPTLIRESLAYLPQWRSSARLMTALRRWKEARFVGDKDVWPVMAHWMSRENHLHLWESGERRAALAHRLDFYRNLAKKIAQSYDVVAIEDFDLRKVAERGSPEKRDPDPHQAARHQRFIVAVSKFRQELVFACQKAGTRVMKVQAAGTTVDCSFCGHTEHWDQAAQLVHTCSSCGRTWDQDDNGGRNIRLRALTMLREEREEEDNLPGTVPPPSPV